MVSRKVEKHKDGMKRVRVGNKIMGTLPSEEALGKNNKSSLDIKTNTTDTVLIEEKSHYDLEQMAYLISQKKNFIRKIEQRENLNMKADEQINYYKQLEKRLEEGDYYSHDEINLMYAVDVDNPNLGYREAYLKKMPDGSCYLKIISHNPTLFDEDGDETQFNRVVDGINLNKEIYLPNYPILDRAQSLSYDIHFGQTDKLGVPYYQHPAGVVEYLETLPEYEEMSEDEKEDAKVAAWLHDSVEDSIISLDVLRKQDFSERSVAAIDALSIRKGETRDAYYERIVASGPIARAVKLADLGHNTLPSRRETLPGSPTNPVEEGQNNTYVRLGRKYAKAFKALNADIPKHLREYA